MSARECLSALLIGRVGKVSGIEVSGRVSDMPEMPGIKPTLWAPKMHIMPKTINHEKQCLKIVYSYTIEVADSESDLSLCNREFSFADISILLPAGKFTSSTRMSWLLTYSSINCVRMT